LRDVLATLQQARRDKQIKTKAKYLPPRKAPADGSWPDFWTEKCEESFTALKALVCNAVDLQIPDFEGAADESNILHIWPDACNYGVGAGLF